MKPRRRRPATMLTPRQLAVVLHVRDELPARLRHRFALRVARGVRLQGSSFVTDLLLQKLIDAALNEMGPSP